MAPDEQLFAACANCINDEFLRNIVADKGEALLCTSCGNSDTPAYTVEDFAALLQPILRDRLAWGEEIRVFDEAGDDRGGYEQQGISLEDMVSEVLGQELDFLDEIATAVIESENVWPPDGEEAFFEDQINYVFRRAPVEELLDQWDAVQEELRRSKRFFSTAAKSFFEATFEGVETLRVPQANDDGPLHVVRELAQGTAVFRARPCDSPPTLQKIYDAPYLHVGPPPAEKARAGRMNAEGIVVLYAGMDAETTVAEVRPPIGGQTALITLNTDRPLRVLDFQLLEAAYSYGTLSHFQPDFDTQRQKHAFLRRLHNLISRPVLPGREVEYLITQTMAEFLSHIVQPSFDGILFGSVQRRGGTNIVLFADANGAFPVTYADNSLKGYRTDAIEYANRQGTLFVHNNTVYLSGADLRDEY